MTTTLQVTKREKGQKSEGAIPAVMYGAHAQSTPIFINKNDFIRAYREAGESRVISLSGDSTENVLIHDVQMDPVFYTPIHADLYVVEKGQKVRVNVPIVFNGESPAVRAGANLVKVMHELSVEADPIKLPNGFTVDLSRLVDLDSTILVSDVVLPAGVTLYDIHPEDVIASVVTQVEEDFSAPTAVDMDAIEVAKKGKKEDEEAAE